MFGTGWMAKNSTHLDWVYLPNELKKTICSVYEPICIKTNVWNGFRLFVINKSAVWGIKFAKDFVLRNYTYLFNFKPGGKITISVRHS